MNEDDNIKWEDMNFDGMEQHSAPTEEKVYAFLCMELEDKCCPKHFLDTTMFDSANSIYAELKKIERGYEFYSDIPEKSLIPIRDRAIHELGIRIQTKSKVDYLMQYFAPEIYMSMNPYPEERIRQANDYRKRVLQNSEDILALEAIESEASEFIAKRDEEIKQEKEKQEKEKQVEQQKKELEQEEERRREFRDAGIIAVVILAIMLLGIILAIT